MAISPNFWKNKKLSDFTEEEWEAICTNCGRCCLIKLQDEESDDVFFTDVICRYHDNKTHKCTQYCKKQKYSHLFSCFSVLKQDSIIQGICQHAGDVF